MKKVAVFLGTRPDAIKMAPIVAALRATHDLDPITISTGQHRELLEQALVPHGLPIDHDLDCMAPGSSLATLYARILERADTCLSGLRPAFCLVQGDTTTCFAAGLAAFLRHVPIGHVEAGLRTGNLDEPFPEEANRRLVTSLSALHFAPTEGARANLLAEGVPADAIHVTGNTGIDALHMELARQERPAHAEAVRHALSQRLGEDWRARPIVLVTLHRRESLGAGLAAICTALSALAARHADHVFVFPVHPNPQVAEPVRAMLSGRANVRLVAPLDHACFVALLGACRIVLTDSGGIQEEAPGLGKPVLVARERTERPEGVAAGTAALVGTRTDTIVAGVSTLLTDQLAYARAANAVNPYGDGRAALRIVRAVAERLGTQAPDEVQALA